MLAKGKKAQDERNSTDKRLDAIIRILVEVNKNKTKSVSEPEAAVILNSVGLTPTEIARIFGKKSRTEVSGYLYGKK